MQQPALARTFRVLAISVAVHGALFALASTTIARIDAPGLEALGWAYLFLLVVPALILAWPFSPVLWHFHLMQTPGWFAWPKPEGFVIAYAVWGLVLLAVALVARRR